MYLSQLSVETLAELSKRVLAISKKEIYPLAQNQPLLIKLETTTVKYLEVFDKLTYSGLGKKVADADLKRDLLFKAFRDVVTGLSTMAGYSGQSAAHDIRSLIRKYGESINNMSYGDQSSHLDKLISELDTDTNQAKIAGLNLTESYTLLRQAQQQFSVIFHEQVAANADLRSKLSASSIAHELTTDIRNYLNFVEAMSSIDPTWKSLSLEINEVLKATKGRKAKPEAAV